MHRALRCCARNFVECPTTNSHSARLSPSSGASLPLSFTSSSPRSADVSSAEQAVPASMDELCVHPVAPADMLKLARCVGTFCVACAPFTFTHDDGPHVCSKSSVRIWYPYSGSASGRGGHATSAFTFIIHPFIPGTGRKQQGPSGDSSLKRSSRTMLSQALPPWMCGTAGGSSSACIASGSTGTLMYRARRWRSRTCAGGDAAGVRRGSLTAFGIVLAAA